ncbi:MAG TPA: NAD-dependent epimerase/dehydratase family protein [Pseudonocardiaceae bacterium]|jgi:uncharacterized protein YbjT (DUF2867 family)
MKVLLFGATGMVGQGVLLECLRDERVEQVLAVGRASVGRQHAKLREVVRPDLFDLSPVRDELAGYDACFFCLGVSSAGMKEADYRRITYDLTLAVARMLAETTPDMTFVYVSGQGTDSSEHGRLMWARVKGATENALRALPLRTYLFRPGIIQPVLGVRSKTRLYAAIYRVVGPLFPLLRRMFPRAMTTTEVLGRAMIEVAAHGAPNQVMETPDINDIGAKRQ